MNTPNRIDDRLHIGLLVIAFCMVLAVIVDAQRPALPISALASPPVPTAAATAQGEAPAPQS